MAYERIFTNKLFSSAHIFNFKNANNNVKNFLMTLECKMSKDMNVVSNAITSTKLLPHQIHMTQSSATTTTTITSTAAPQSLLDNPCLIELFKLRLFINLHKTNTHAWVNLLAFIVFIGWKYF